MVCREFFHPCLFTKNRKAIYMNNRESEILCVLSSSQFVSQKALAEACGCSATSVKRALKNLVEQGYVNENMETTDKAASLLQERKPKNAVILAAGYCMRMVPINTQTPKGLVEVHGQKLVERLILQLHEVGITRISVVVGFMKEQFEYLIDEYGVELVVNDSYAAKNNLHSVNRVLQRISNTYVIPCDIWCDTNPFRELEPHSWYMVSRQMCAESCVRVNRNMELVRTSEDDEGNKMIGISYLLEEQAKLLREKVSRMSQKPRYDGSAWEEALYEHGKMLVPARVVEEKAVVEINTYEQLRELDRDSNQLKVKGIAVITKALGVQPEDIQDISVLKKGMTNRSFFFSCNNERYIMRIPGEGTDQLINRREEATVYKVIAGRGICDDIVYIDPDTGYKITKFLENARCCDPDNLDDIRNCMEKLRRFHELNLKVEHIFDIFGKIDFYESLWNGEPSIFKDYQKTKENIFSLRPYIEEHVQQWCLTHVDAVPDNFLMRDTEQGQEIRLIDWEYAAMQDPHVDLAMFCIYAMYDREHVEQLIDSYFVEGCPQPIRTKIYCYIAACGLLWSNWCEYKRMLGVEFGEYSLSQYRFAKDYFKIAKEQMGK